jgi:hypothetical protein
MMYGLGDLLETADREQERRGFDVHPWGQGAAMKRETPAGELAALLVRDAQNAFANMRMASRPRRQRRRMD